MMNPVLLVGAKNSKATLKLNRGAGLGLGRRPFPLHTLRRWNKRRGKPLRSHSHLCVAVAATRADVLRKPSSSGRKSLRIHEGELRPLTQKASDDMIPVYLKDGRIVTDLGLSLIEGTTPASFCNHSESRDGALVLGFNSQNGATSMEDFPVGKLVCERFLASARCKLWWMTPEWGREVHDLPPETQFLLVEVKEGGPYAIFLPLIDKGVFRATLRAPKCRHIVSDDLMLRIESGTDNVVGSKWNSALYVAAGWEPFKLVERGVSAAAMLSGGAKPRSEKRIPPSLDVFGWCTWDAFYSTVSAKGVAEGLNSLCQGGTPPRLLIIDDGWQNTDHDPPLRKPPTAAFHLPKQEETEKECTIAEAECLAEASAHIPVGSAEVLMPTLSGVGPPKDKTVEDDDDYDMKEEEVRAAVSLVQRVTGWIMGLVQGFLLFLYEFLIDKAPPNSGRVKFFAALAKGPLRKMILQFYAAAGDFTRRLVDVKANGKFSSPFAGPETNWEEQDEQLGEVIAYLRHEFGVKFVYCWHGLPAYWSGIMPDGHGVAKYNPKIVYAKPTPGLLEIEPSLAWNPSVLCGIGIVDDVEGLYEEMHAYLMAAGVDGVKVDCQAGVGLIGSVLGGGAALSKTMHAALERSAQMHFPGNHVINCMCHSTENLYRMENTAVARASDDFYPRDPSSTTPHIAASAYNSLFLAPLVHPDWDMFQSKHPAAELHAMARAVCGSSVYVSDKPGEHDFELLSKMVLPDGSVLRTQIPGRPTRDCLFRNVLKDGRTLLKVWSVNTYSGVVGVFNLQGSSWDRDVRRFYTHNPNPPHLQTRVTPRDIENLLPIARELRNFSGHYAAFCYKSQDLHIGDEDICVSVELDAQSSDVISFSPVLQLDGVRFAPVGLSNMMNGTGAVRSCSVDRKNVGVVVKQMNGGGNGGAASRLDVLGLKGSCTMFRTEMFGCGKFLCYASKAPVDVWSGTQSLEFEYDMQTGALTMEVPPTETLESIVTVIF